MSMRPETRYTCDRCFLEEIVPLDNTPMRFRKPYSTWLMLTVDGATDGEEPKHLCPDCRAAFEKFMGRDD